MHPLPPDIASEKTFSSHFTPYQVDWIMAEDPIHAQGKQAIILAEKSVRTGFTFCDGFKNVRKRILFKKRDYLFATRDFPSAKEFVLQAYRFAELFNLTHYIIYHDTDDMRLDRLNQEGKPSGLTEEIKIGLIKFDNGSRIIAFSANPQAMAVYGGDVGLDEFAKHPNARLLWETAQGRITLGGDLAVWSAHDGEDTLFNEFAQEARAACKSGELVQVNPGYWHRPAPSAISKIKNFLGGSSAEERKPTCPWNVYFKVTMQDAINNGLVKMLNRVAGTNISDKTFLEDCRLRARDEEIFQQAYMCNPAGAATNHIVEWSSIENCRADYEIARVHLEHAQIVEKFGEFSPSTSANRETEIARFLLHAFNPILTTKSKYRLGFEVAASGQGHLAAFYIDELKGTELWLRALFTCRTEDWNFLRTVLFYFLRMLQRVQAAGDETGLGKQICWEAAKYYGQVFTSVNFSSKKSELGFTLMNELATATKRFPRAHQDIAADYFALRKVFQTNRWIFTEGRNAINPNSHCDIAWAGALASEANKAKKPVLTSRLG